MKRITVILLALALLVSCATGESFVNDYAAMNEAAASVLILTLYDDKDTEIGKVSGFMAFDDSHAVTTWAAVSSAARIEAVTDMGDTLGSFKVLGCDSDCALAIIAFDEPTGLKPLTLNEDSFVRRGAVCVSIGEQDGFNSINTGNISAYITAEGYDIIQFSAPITEGASGGVLLDEYGNAAGMTLIGLNGDIGYTVIQNMNYAIGARHIRELWEICCEDEPVELQNWGVTDVNPESPYPLGEDWFIIENRYGSSVNSFKLQIKSENQSRDEEERMKEWLRNGERMTVELNDAETAWDGPVSFWITVPSTKQLYYNDTDFTMEDLRGRILVINKSEYSNRIVVTIEENPSATEKEPRRHDKPAPEGEEFFTVPETIERENNLPENLIVVINHVEDSHIKEVSISDAYYRSKQILYEGEAYYGEYAVVELSDELLNNEGETLVFSVNARMHSTAMEIDSIEEICGRYFSFELDRNGMGIIVPCE